MSSIRLGRIISIRWSLITAILADSSWSISWKRAVPKSKRRKEAEGGSLGRCVRRVVISTTYELFRAAHGLYPDDVLLDGKMVARAFRGYTKYMVVLASLFTHCLPNVEVVQWKDPVAMDAALFHAITSSSARSLQLERFQVRRFAPHSSSRYLRSLGGTGTLNTLHLNLLQCQWGSGIHQQCFSAAKVIYGLLELVAPTCEELLLFNTSVLPHGPPPTLPRFSDYVGSRWHGTLTLSIQSTLVLCRFSFQIRNTPHHSST